MAEIDEARLEMWERAVAETRAEPYVPQGQLELQVAYFRATTEDLCAALRAARAERDALAAENADLRRVAGVAAYKFRRDEKGRPLGYFCAVKACPRCGTYMNIADEQCCHCDADDIRAVVERDPDRHAAIAEARREVIAAEREIGALELGHTPDAWEAAIARRTAAYARLDALEEGGA